MKPIDGVIILRDFNRHRGDWLLFGSDGTFSPEVFGSQSIVVAEET